MGLEISMRECGDVGVLDLLGRSTIDGGESELLSKHLRNLIAKGKRKLLLNLLNLSQIFGEEHLALRHQLLLPSALEPRTQGRL